MFLADEINTLLLDSNILRLLKVEGKKSQQVVRIYYSPLDLGEIGYLLADYYYRQGIEFREMALTDRAKKMHNSSLEYWNIHPFKNNQFCIYQKDLMEVIKRVWRPFLLEFRKNNSASLPVKKAEAPPHPPSQQLPVVKPPPVPVVSNVQEEKIRK